MSAEESAKLKQMLEEFKENLADGQTDLEKQVKRLQLSMVGVERNSDSNTTALDRIRSDVKNLQATFSKDADNSMSKLEALASSGSSVDPATMIQAMQGLKIEMFEKFMSREDMGTIKTEIKGINENINKKIGFSISELEDSMADLKSEQKEKHEEFDLLLESHNRMIAARLETTTFDDEIEEITAMINALSDLGMATSSNDKILSQIAKKEQARDDRKKNRGSGLSDEMKNKIEDLLRDVPNLITKQKAQTKLLEQVGLKGLKARL